MWADGKTRETEVGSNSWIHWVYFLQFIWGKFLMFSFFSNHALRAGNLHAIEVSEIFFSVKRYLSVWINSFFGFFLPFLAKKKLGESISLSLFTGICNSVFQ